MDKSAFKIVAVKANFETLPHLGTEHIFRPMQFSDFFNVGSGLGDAVKIVLFRMLPRGAQIQKVRAEPC